MEAKELRVGNYVYAQSGKLVVNRDSIYKVENVNMQSARKYEPIPLTEEWLLKFGFEDITGVDYILHIDSDFKLLLIPADGFYPQIDKADDSGWQSVSLNKIEFVHQLQNLYFALTGEELI